MNSIQRERVRESHQVMAVLPKERNARHLSLVGGLHALLCVAQRVWPQTLAAEGLIH
jgi:hypothetical protein